MHCPQCNAELAPNARFCAMCGTPAPKPKANGVQIGDVGLIKELHIGAEGKSANGPAGGYCDICGIWAQTEASFRCRECGRVNLHVEHRNPELGVCIECAPLQPPEPLPPPKFGRMKMKSKSN